MDALTIRDTLIAALMPLNADITDGAPETDREGRIRRTVILNVPPGTVGTIRASGAATTATRTVEVLVVTAAKDSCTILAERVRDALDGTRFGSPHGTIRDVSYDGVPTPEPDITPARWSKALAFTVTTKRGSHAPHV